MYHVTFHERILLAVITGTAAGAASVPSGTAVALAYEVADLVMEERKKRLDADKVTFVSKAEERRNKKQKETVNDHT